MQDTEGGTFISKVTEAFSNGKAFIPFLTAGEPNIEKTENYILELEKAGADLIEIGIPFSDPIAEGVVIQEADLRSLKAGTTTDKIFDIVASVRRKTDIPLVFMTYLNPVFHYGYEPFFTKCEEVGINGIIIPDMPYEEKGELNDIARSHQVDVISLIAPTSEQRIQKIAADAEGFIYLVSGRYRCQKRDQDRPRFHDRRNPQSNRYSGSRRLRHQHDRSGGQHCKNCGRCHRWKRYRQNDCEVRHSCGAAHLYVCPHDEGSCHDSK